MCEMLPGEIKSRKLLVFSWDEREVEPELFRTLARLPVEAFLVTPGEEAFESGLMSDPKVIACLFVVSRQALAAPAFPRSVQACVRQLVLRKELRLFVYLSDLTSRELAEIAQTNLAAADLIDSVHIGASLKPAQAGDLVRSIEAHLRALPEILDALSYERWKQAALGFVPFLNLAGMVLLAIGIWPLASGQPAINDDRLCWALVAVGALSYTSVLALLSLGSNLHTGSILRWGVVLFPLWVINSVPSSKLVANWPPLLAGFGAGFLLDEIRRMWAQSQRERIPIVLPQDEPAERGTGLPGGRHWQMLTTAPVLGADVRIFISYSRASPWGSATASALHEAFKKIGLSSFRDVEGISEGTSWRHKIQEAIGRSTVFVAVQDALTAARHWPNAELEAAIKSQIYCGSPSILIVRDAASLGDGLEGAVASRLTAVLSQRGEIDPTLLRVIDFRPDTPRHLSQGLMSFEPASVVNPRLARLLRMALAPWRVALAGLGTLGAGLAVIAGLGWLVLSLLGVQVEEWLKAHDLSFPCLVLTAFELGFLVRLAFSGRFELRTAEAPDVLRLQLLGVFMLLWVARMVSPGQDSLAFVFAGDALGLGFLLASDFVSTTLPRSGKYRPSPL